MSETWFRKRRGFFLSFSLSDTPHYPYLLPKGWKWCKLEDIVSFGGGKTPSMDNKEYWDNGKHLWVTSKDMKCSHITNSLMKITDKALVGMTLYEKGTLLVVTRSGILRHTLPLSILEKPATVNQDLKTISPHIQELSEYLYVIIKANEHIILKEYHKDGTTVDSIDFDKFRCLPIPLAPIAEQKRIIAETKNWLSLIDQIEQGKADLQTTIKQTKSKILDLAIHGKLVPQDPNDEPAVELLKRINPNFTPCDNGHSEKLPQGWSITELTNLADIKNGYAFKSSNYISSNGVRLIRIANVQDGYIEDKMPQFYPFDKMKALKDFMLTEGDILMSLTGNVGRVGILTNELLPAALNQRVACIKEHPNIIAKKFLFYTFQTSNFSKDCVKSGKGVAQLNISTEWLKHYFILIPPLTEQQRIVQKIEELFSVLDNIQNALEV